MVDYATNIGDTNPETTLAYSRWITESDGSGYWSTWYGLEWSKYQIKEADMRIKTMTFTSSRYIDLTKGQVMVMAVCEGHENFYGYILSVEESSDGLYNYSCQDFNRELSEKISIAISDIKVYNLIRTLLGYPTAYNPNTQTYEHTTEFVKNADNYFSYRGEEGMLGLLLPIEDYNQEAYEDIQEFNPMKKVINVIYDKQTRGDILRSLIYQNDVFVDFYYPNIVVKDKDGKLTAGLQAPAVEPYSPKKWLGEGLYFTTPELAEYKMKFDTTNIVTGVNITKSDKAVYNQNSYSSKDLLGVDLSIFFGRMNTTISNPAQSNTTGTNSTDTSTALGGGSGVTPGTTVYINCDNIYGKRKDAQMLADCASALKSHGYNVVNPNHIGPGYHVSDLRDRLPKNACLFTIVGGICSGTFIDMCATYYQNYIKQKKAKVVLGCLAPPIKDDLDTLPWLKRAWDDNFSAASFKGLSYPGKYLKDHGINYIYGSNGTDLGNKFYKGGGGLTTVAK